MLLFLGIAAVFAVAGYANYKLDGGDSYVENNDPKFNGGGYGGV